MLRKFGFALAAAAALCFGGFTVAAAQTAHPPAVEETLQAPMVLNAAERAPVYLAQVPGDENVAIPWGDWLVKVIGVFSAAIATAVFAGVSKIFGDKIAKEQLRAYTDAAVSYAINVVQGAAAGKELDVHVANAVLERALEYSVDLFGTLVDKFGGTDAQRLRIISKLQVQASQAMTPPARIVGRSQPLVVRRAKDLEPAAAAAAETTQP